MSESLIRAVVDEIHSVRRSENLYRAVAALTSLIHVTMTKIFDIAPFFIAVSEFEPFISHLDPVINSLAESNQDKKYFHALGGLAKATALLYVREEVPDDLPYYLWDCLIKLLYAYGYVLLQFCILTYVKKTDRRI